MTANGAHSGHSRSVVTSAPGKVILHGEHAVVHGKMAIAASLGLRTCVKISRDCEAGDVHFVVPDIFDVNCHWSTEALQQLSVEAKCTSAPAAPTVEQMRIIREFVHARSRGNMPDKDPAGVAAAAFLYLLLSIFAGHESIPPARVYVKSQLPIGAGLGSSAAYSVALAAALLVFAGRVSQGEGAASHDGAWTWSGEDADLINTFGYMAEKVIHGNPSGIDNAVACYGGAIRFTKGKEMAPLSMPALRICLANTRVPRSTKALVAEVGRRKELLPGVVGHVLEAMQEISDECLRVFGALESPATTEDERRACYRKLETMIDINHYLLVALGVGHTTLEELCRVSAARGFHSKLTGAGGGGCALTLVPEDCDHSQLDEMVRELEAEGFECWETAIGCSGVTLHKDEPEWL